MSSFAKVQELIVDQLGVEEIEVTPEATFDDLTVDSLDHVEMVMSFEEEFGLEISDEDAQKWKNVGDIVKYVDAAVRLRE